MFKDITVTFNIVNLTKGSLFSAGMKPAVFSLKSYEIHRIGWNRKVKNINITKNTTVKVLFFNIYYLKNSIKN